MENEITSIADFDFAKTAAARDPAISGALAKELLEQFVSILARMNEEFDNGGDFTKSRGKFQLSAGFKRITDSGIAIEPLRYMILATTAAHLARTPCGYYPPAEQARRQMFNRMVLAHVIAGLPHKAIRRREGDQ